MNESYTFDRCTVVLKTDLPIGFSDLTRIGKADVARRVSELTAIFTIGKDVRGRPTLRRVLSVSRSPKYRVVVEQTQVELVFDFGEFLSGRHVNYIATVVADAPKRLAVTNIEAFIY